MNPESVYRALRAKAGKPLETNKMTAARTINSAHGMA